MRFYIILIGVALLIAGLAYSHSLAYVAGKDKILTELKDQRIQVLKDGRKIDEQVLTADDDALYCMLVDCGLEGVRDTSGS